jgi:hypothetical protein
MMKRLLPTAIWLVVCASAAFAQAAEGPPLNRDPERVSFVTSDIDNFWRAYDLALREPDRERRIDIFQREYIDRGSAGLKDFVRLRIKSAKDLAGVVEGLPKFFASVRASTLRVRGKEREMRAAFRRLKRLYPDAVFPDVYFVIGVTNTGGTVSDSGLLIGAELYGATPRTPREEFYGFLRPLVPRSMSDEQARQAVARMIGAALKPVEDLPPIVAHELIHFNQKYPEQKTLLDKALQEGSADFVGRLIVGRTIGPVRQSYGDAHEAELWREFQTGMHESDMKRWLYNGLTSADRPSDLGYYMGYKISESYYRRAKDKRRAVRDILEIKDFRGFLEQSRYGEKFTK